VFVVFLLMGQETLTNESIIKLVKSGMGEQLILNVIRQQPGNYSMAADDLVALKEAGVSERIISAMLSRGRGPAPAADGAAAATASRHEVSQPGLYYKKANEFFELVPEEVEWQTKGAMKNIVSAGIVKKDLKGTIPGPSSRNFLNHPIEVIFALESGQSINDYLLVPMRVNKGQRMFVVGPVNTRSGVAKGAIPFGVEKVGETQFRLVLQSPLAPGEYGILRTSTVGSETGSSKIYTFRLIL
jgi:hypothetical protein